MSKHAIQLISIDDIGNFVLNPEAEDFISSIESNISSLCIVGKYRTGKSYLLNKIINNSDSKGFEISSTTNSCTKGIWVWNEPVTFNNSNNNSVLIMDTEGLLSGDRDKSIDQRIFVLSILLSSYFIFNSMHSIDEASIEALSLVIQFAKKIQTEFVNNEENFNNNFPKFLWVLRDFNLDLVDNDNNPITAKEYLEEALKYREDNTNNNLNNSILNSSINLNASTIDSLQMINETRKQIKLVFKDRDLKTIPAPAEYKKLKNLNTLGNNQLKENFKLEIKNLVNYIGINIKPKLLQGSYLNGKMFVNLIKTYIKALNSENLPNIKSSWKIVVDNQVNDIQEKAFNKYLDEMIKLEYKYINDYEYLIFQNKLNVKKSNDILRKELLKINIPLNYYIECCNKLDDKIEDYFNKILIDWKEYSINKCNDDYEQIIEEYEKTNKETNDFDTLTLLDFFEELLKLVDDSFSNAKKYEIIYPKVNKYFINKLRNNFLEESNKFKIEKNKLNSEKESLLNLIDQTKKLSESNKAEYELELNRIKEDMASNRLNFEAKIEESYKMNKAMIDNNNNTIKSLKDELDFKNKELLDYNKSYNNNNNNNSKNKKNIINNNNNNYNNSVLESIISKLDNYKDNYFTSELNANKLNLKREIAYRIEDLQNDFQKKLSQLRKDTEKIVLQVKADAKREIDEYKQLLKVCYIVLL